MKKNFIFTILVSLILFPIIADAKVKIKDQEYDTLEEAISAHQEGDTLTLLDDLDLSDPSYGSYYNWFFKKGATLDLNGHSITTGVAGGDPNAVWLGDDITIRNGYFKTKTDANYTLFLGDLTTTYNITLEDITVETGINIFNTLNVTLKNVTATGKTYYAVWLDEHATVTIESGNYNNRLGKYVLGATTSKPEGDEPAFKSELTILGGTFKAEEDKLVLPPGEKGKYLPPIIKGGTYDFDVSKYTHEDYECKKSKDKYTVSLKTYDRGILVDNDNSEIKIAVDSDELSKVLLENLKQLSNIQIDKKDIDILLNIEDVTPTEEIENKIQNIKANIKVDNYFDITIDILDKSSNSIIGNLTELDSKLSFTIDIPEHFIQDDGISRTFYILREHEGEVEILESTLSEDKKKLSFETDRFSTYALAYVEKKEVEIDNPQTNDNLLSNIVKLEVLGVTALSCMIYIYRKRIS